MNNTNPSPNTSGGSLPEDQILSVSPLPHALASSWKLGLKQMFEDHERMHPGAPFRLPFRCLGVGDRRSVSVVCLESARARIAGLRAAVVGFRSWCCRVVGFPHSQENVKGDSRPTGRDHHKRGKDDNHE